MYRLNISLLTKRQYSIWAKFFTLTAACSLLFATGKPAKAEAVSGGESSNLIAIDQGTVANVFTECINDGIAWVRGKNSADQYGWQYAVDSFNDGVSGLDIGGNVYEIYSLAIRETSDSIWVALNSHLPLTGADAVGAVDGNIGWGDLFFNFSGKDFTTASNEGSLFGVRFAQTNDSFVPTLGLYGNVTAASTTSVNSGFNSIADYNNHVTTYGCQGAGCGPSFGDLSADTTYFDQNQSLNTIAAGTFLTGITFVSDSDLSTAGYELNRFSGQHTVAFKFDKSPICQAGSCKSVPEPSGVVGLAIVGCAIATHQLSKRRQGHPLANAFKF